MKLVNQKLITCILPKGIASRVVNNLRETFGTVSANINNARGVGKITPLAFRGVGEQTEKEILTVAVDIDQADKLFEFIYDAAEINRPHGGIMYMHPLLQSTEYVLPEINNEED